MSIVQCLGSEDDGDFRAGDSLNGGTRGVDGGILRIVTG